MGIRGVVSRRRDVAERETWIIVRLAASTGTGERAGAKGWLSRHMAAGHYSEPRDQAALTQLFDMQAAQTARSFRKCYKEITALLALLRDRE